MESVNINTNRLFIRNLKPTDLNDFFIYRSNAEVVKYQGFDVMTLTEAAAFIEEQKDKLLGNPGEWIQYGIENRAEQRIIGDCAIKIDEYDLRIAEIGITISHLEQRKGYAKEAMTGVLGFLFDTLNLHRVAELCDTENTASVNLLKSVGFRLEGYFVENVFFKGSWGSEFQYAMLKREWDAKQRVSQ
ncbi:GNAT family N-acetyltransferase [Mucilaginibacter sp.]|uniref:GNAT family N-acetyltransferase n=1 Tax=Mucilaginibacter sp. TaxID=1882438 RepID=UPI003D11B214